MKQERKNYIFDRLMAIRIKIETSSIPSPSYINEKIGECHVAIEEVERFNIEVSKEISITTQAFNSASSEYNMKKQTLLTENKEVLSFQNIKDREAKANSFLKQELETVTSLENEVEDLNNLLKVINLKIKNLNRINTDIKMQLRLLEAQIKLGGGPGSDVATKSLIEEMSKGISNSDSFEDVSSRETVENIMDPTKPIDVEDLLKEEDVLEENNNSDDEEVEPEINSENIEIWDGPQEEVEISTEEPIIDLDKNLNVDLNVDKIEEPVVQNMNKQKNTYDPMDLDDLLDLIQKKES